MTTSISRRVLASAAWSWMLRLTNQNGALPCDLPTWRRARRRTDLRQPGPPTVHTVFGLRSRVILDPISSKPLVLPIGRHHTPAAVADWAS